MSRFSDPNYLRNVQYRTAKNLNARVRLHELFSTAGQDLHRWVFEQIDLPPNSRILEIGCGPGWLWNKNLGRVPIGWTVTLGDLSSGMVQEARGNVGADHHPFTFITMDAQAIPFLAAQFNAVIANHMLYHVPDLGKALADMRRVLKPGGRIYAATNGASHMLELEELRQAFDPQAATELMRLGFSLESGAEQLAPYFSCIERRDFPDTLEISDAGPLMDYYRSTTSYGQSPEFQQRVVAFHDHLTARIAQQGSIHVTKSAGLFIGMRE